MTNNQITARLNELDAKLDLYKKQAKTLGVDAKAEGKSIIATLTNMRKDAARRLDLYSKAKGISIEQAGLNLQKSLDELSDSVKEADRVLKNLIKPS